VTQRHCVTGRKRRVKTGDRATRAIALPAAMRKLAVSTAAIRVGAKREMSEHEQRTGSRQMPFINAMVAEAVVITGMALTTLAFGAVLHLQAGLDFTGAALLALGAYAIMLLVHAFVRPAGTAPPRSDSQDQKPVHDEPTQPAQTAGRPQARPEARPVARHTFSSRPVVIGTAATTAQPEEPVTDPVAIPVRDLITASRALATDGSRSADKVLPDASQDPLGRVRPAPQPELASPRDHEDVPTEPVLSISELTRSARDDGIARELAQPRGSFSEPPREADVEMIQAMIKKLADEVNAVGAVSGSRPDRKVKDAAVPTANVDTEAAISSSVGALRSTAGSMRAREDDSTDLDAPRAAGSVDDSTRPTSEIGLDQASDGAQSHGMSHGHSHNHNQSQTPALGPVIDALAAGRVDVLLDPILGINDRKACHFEVAVRLRDEADAEITFDELGDGLAGRGVLPLIDRARLSGTSQLAVRLEAKGRTGALFSQFAGESLLADQFLDEFADAFRARERFAGQLVMTFAQADIRAFGDREWATLADMADLGFRFAMAGVSDLDMDFEDLQAKGFKFIKLDAEVFLEGLPAGEVRVPASDICRHVAGAGMAVIVGKIADENVAARVFGFGVLLGQGALFGGPRRVKSEAVQPVKGRPDDTRKGHAAA